MARGLRYNSDNITTRQIAQPATGPAPDSSGPTGQVRLSSLRDADDLKAIEALSGTSGSLHKTAANTWALRQSLHTTDTPQFARLGLGGAADGTIPLLVQANGLTNPTPAIDVVADNGTTQANIDATTYGVSGGGIFHGRHANGTRESPSQTLAGNITAGIGARAWESGTNDFQASSPAAIHWVAAENQANTNRGHYLRFLTTPKGSGTRQERMVLTHDGMLVVRDTLTTDFDWLTFPGFGAAAPDVGLLVASGIGGTRSINCTVGVASTAGTTGSGPGYRGFYSGGTWQAPTATPTGKTLCFMGGGGHDGTDWTATKASIFFLSGEAWSGTANGAYIRFDTTPNGSTTRAEQMRLTGAGNLLVGTTSETGLTGAGGLRVASTTEASATAGAAIIDGGVLVKKAGFFIGGATIRLTPLLIGSDASGSGLTDAAEKRMRIGMPHYTNAEEAVSLIFYQSTSSDNLLNIGGGNTVMNAATLIRFHTAGTHNTLTGTERGRFTGDGAFLVGVTANPTAANGSIRCAGIIRTGTPSGGSQGEWMLGTAATASETPMTHKIRIDIGGVAYDLLAVAA